MPNQEAVEQFAADRGIHLDGYSALLTSDELRDQVKREIRQATAELASYEIPKSFALVPEPFAVENGLLTPTLKLRRSKVAERYGEVIEGLYRRRNSNSTETKGCTAQ